MSNKTWAIFLSVFIVGLGQIYLGQSNRGLILCLVFYFGIPLFLWCALNLGFYCFVFSLLFTLIAAPLLWAYNLVDIYKTK
jgi:TM2 domain-containing membrane protein YozV